MDELSCDGKAVKREDLHISQDIGAAEVGEDAAKRTRVETDKDEKRQQSPAKGGINKDGLLVLGQILVQLDIAPRLSAAIDGINIELSRLDIPQLQAAEDVGCVVDQEAEGPRSGCQIQDIVAGEVGGCLGQHQRVGEELEEGTVLDFDGQSVGNLTGLGHRIA
jgi:hypothetical protein